MRTYRVGAAKPGSNEHTLDKARQDDYILDMRTVPDTARLAGQGACHLEHRRRVARPHGVQVREN